MGSEARSLARCPMAKGKMVYLPGGTMIRVSGIGPERASLAVKALIEEGATALLSWGIAGGLVSKLSSGGLVVPKVIIGTDRSVYPTDEQWHERLCSRLRGHVDLHEGPLAETSTPLSRPSDKEDFYRRTEAIAVDMESRTIAALARKADLTFMAIRAISDPLDQRMPEFVFHAIDTFGELDGVRFAKGLFRHPFDILSLIYLGQNFRAARMTLAKVVSLTGTDLLVS